MAKRTSISTRTRFEIFKRDGFRCVYCGRTPSRSELRVDHVIAVANGGTNELTNLVTACHTCNAGKAAVPIDDVRGDRLIVMTESAARQERVSAMFDYWCQRIGSPHRSQVDPLCRVLDGYPWSPIGLLPLVDKVVAAGAGSFDEQLALLRSFIVSEEMCINEEMGFGSRVMSAAVSTWPEATHVRKGTML